MKILLDTHIILWALKEDPQLPPEITALLLDTENKIYYSSVSSWEIAIKHKVHPDKILMNGKHFIECCQKAGYEMLPLKDEHVFALETIKRPEDAPPHKDPFDQILIAQAKAEGFLFVTHDAKLPYYNESCIKFV